MGHQLEAGLPHVFAESCRFLGAQGHPQGSVVLPCVHKDVAQESLFDTALLKAGRGREILHVDQEFPA